MKFLKAESIPLPTVSVSSVVKAALEGPRTHRGYKHIHASDLTKPTFCPREVCLLDREKIAPKREYLSAALAMTFDVGNATADLLVNSWAGDRVVGNWECSHCGHIYNFCRKPSPCKCHARAFYSYREVRFTHQETKASGGIDALFDLDEPKLTVVELKIMKPEDFANLVAPLAEHRVRTQMYLDIIDGSDHAYKSSIDLSRGVVCYISRGYGKKNGDLGVLPLKEFVVPRDTAGAAPYLDKARQITTYHRDGTLPPRICTSDACTRAKKCPVRVDCFEDDPCTL